MSAEQHAGFAVGSHITAEQPVGVVRVLATVTAPGLAMCTHRTKKAQTSGGGEHVCGTPIQRTSKGDLADGVRAHYRTVHPERRIA